jgi:ATP-dependent Lon protease
MSETNLTGGEISRDRVYPVLPLRDIVVFTGLIVPRVGGREK